MNKLYTFSITMILALVLVFTLPAITSAQTCEGSGPNFVDLNGDGFNDNAPEDGSGYQHQKGELKQKAEGNQFKTEGETKKNQHQVKTQLKEGEADPEMAGLANQVQNKGENKEGFKSQMQQFEGNGTANRNMYKNGDGTGGSPDNGGNGTGTCDGTGPKGKQNGGKK